MLRSRSSLAALVFGFGLVLSGASLADQILEVYSASITTYLPSGKTKVQNLRPLASQRGVNLDGSLRAAPGIPAALAGNPFERAAPGSASLESVRLDTGSFHPTEVDIALPAPGFRWIVGRTFSSRQYDGGTFASNGYQGRNWAQSSQPELHFYDDVTSAANDVAYLVYGADRYVEFQRDGVSSNDFKGKNGVAGAFVHTAGSPDIWTYHGPDGTTIDFFGDDTASNKADWQLWRITDAAGNVAYVGDASSASSAVTNGFDAGGRITTAYDTANRRYTYTYSSHDSVTRLDGVEVETKTGGTWASPSGLATVSEVTYTYYSSESYGEIGDLKTVTITTPTSDSGVQAARTKYFRYWGDSAYHSTTHPGNAHELMLVLDYEGARAFDYTDSTFDSDFTSAATNDLKPYSIAYFEYESGGKINLATFNGSCGCGGGGAEGDTQFIHATSGFTNTSGYDAVWATRTVVVRADGTYMTQYFDEVGQTLSQVITDTNPASSPTETWVVGVTRDSMGCVSEVATPASIASYTHSTGAFTLNISAGLIRSFVRASSTDVKGFVTDTTYKTGSSGSAYLDGTWTFDYTTATKTLTDVTISRPLIASEREYTAAVTSGTSGSNLTSHAYTAYGSPNTLSIEKMVTTHPTVSTGTNGSNSADSSSEHFRLDGLVDFAKSEVGQITYTAYTNGQMSQRIEDADTTSLSPPTGFSSSGTRAHLVTTYTYGTNLPGGSITHPSGRRPSVTFGVLLDRRLVRLTYPHSTVGGTLYGPVDVELFNLADEVVAAAIAAPVGGTVDSSVQSANAQLDETKDNLVEAVETGSITVLSTRTMNESGHHLVRDQLYTTIPSSLPGTLGTHFDESTTAEDDMGRVIRRVDATGTITRTVYDTLGRGYQTWIGTNDNGLAGGSPSGTNNMVKVEELEFDGGSAGGNGYLTERTSFVEGTTTNQRVTSYTHDVRGNVLLVDNPTGPDQLTKYDNLSRAIAVGQYSSTSATNDPTSTATNRLALSQTFFDERGREWKSQRHNIDVSDGSDDDNLQTLTWYDAAGRVLKVDGEQLTKTQYDSAGRVLVQYVLASDNDSAYGDVDDVTGDIVLEQHQTAYDSGGRTIVQASISRYHTDLSTPTGSLDTGLATPDAFTLTGTPDVLGRIQIEATSYDSLDRVADTAQYGTHSGANFSYAGASFTPSGSVLVTSRIYNDDGTLKEVEDPKGLVTRYEYDAAQRRTKVIANYVDGSPSSATADDDQVVEYGYTNGLQTSITAKVYGGGDQVTRYFYGTRGGTPSAMKISTGNLLRAVKYPDSANAQTTVGGIEDTDSTDVVLFAYNAQGQQTWKKDQYVTSPSAAGGNVIETTYDDAGRETSRAVTTLASGFDGAVRRVETGYTALGQVETVTQYDAASSGSVVDQAKYIYDGWGNVLKFRQDIDGTVGGSGFHEVECAYEKATSGRNTIRRTSMKLGGKTFTLSYVSLGGLGDGSYSRVTSIKDGATTLVKYDYLGADQVVGTTYDEPDVFSKQYSSTAGAYPDLDLFNRVVVSKWTKDLATDVNFYSNALTYDANSNITSNDDAVQAGVDVKYAMDNLNRLIDADEGTLSSGSITARTRRQEWDLSQTGNWIEDKLDLNGDGDGGDTDEWLDAKTFNAVNEILTRDLDSNSGTTGNNHALAYDLAGNLTSDPSADRKYEWDAFYRLRKVTTQAGAPVAEYRYNGLGHRIGTLEDTDLDSDVDGSDLWYYSSYDERWRMVATYRGSDADPKERFVHQQAGASGDGGSSYIDLVAFRERDVDDGWTGDPDGTYDERLYYCQNQHADVVALVTDAGAQREMARYSAYGVPFGLPVGDTNSDGDCDQADQNQVRDWALATPAVYDVRGDLDLDGDVDLTDRDTLRDNYKGVTLGRGVLSAPLVVNRFGQAGHVLRDGAVQHARARLWSGALGTWWTRDPGFDRYPRSLYQVCALLPSRYVDPTGREPQNPQDPYRNNRGNPNDRGRLKERVQNAPAGSGPGTKGEVIRMAIGAIGATSRAAKEAEARGFTPADKDGTPYNALKHCILACDYNLRFGGQRGEELTDEHETEDGANYTNGKANADTRDSTTWTDTNGRPKSNMGMDLHNNREGARCAALIATCGDDFMGDMSPLDKCQKCCGDKTNSCGDGGGGYLTWPVTNVFTGRFNQ